MVNTSLLLSFISGISTFIGSLVIFFKFKRVEELIVFCLSFSIGIMICVSLFELIPISFFNIVYDYGIIKGILIFIISFILGIFILYLIDNKLKNCIGLERIGVLNFISLIMHNIPEGIIVYMSSSLNINLGIKMCLSIMLHNIPEGMCIALPLFYSKSGRGRALLLTLISGFAELFGAIICHILLRNLINNTIISIIQIFVAGFMINLSINKIFKEIIQYNKSTYIFLGIFTSCLFSSIILLFNFN